MTAEEMAALKKEQDAMIEEQRKSEKEKKVRFISAQYFAVLSAILQKLYFSGFNLLC